jgi:hypothetical protein
VLRAGIGRLPKRPAGRPPHEVRRYRAGVSCRAGSRDKARRVVAEVGWRPGEPYPRAGFIVANVARPAERVAAFHSRRGTAERWIGEGKDAVIRTRLPCRRLAANAVPFGCDRTRRPTTPAASCAPRRCPTGSGSGRWPRRASGW